MRRILSLLLAFVGVVWLCACAQTFLPTRTAVSGALQSGTLAELEVMPSPEGVDAALWAKLKDALRLALAEQPKQAATPPTGEANRVLDLAITNDDGHPRFTWHYRNLGDYNQNGRVGIEDITPLAQHFSETYDQIMEQNSLAAMIDGSGNGKVDIADVTPIAVGFGASCTAYKIQNAPSYSSITWTDLVEVSQTSGIGNGRLEYAQTVGVGDGEYYRVVPVDADGVEGEPSNVRQFANTPPEVTGVSPTGGIAGAQVLFAATVTGSEPIGVQWDFGDGASPRQPYGKQVTVTLGDVGEFPCSVTASNALDSDTLEFTLTVEPVPPEPPDIQSVTPTEGVTGTPVQFSAVVTGDGPLTYYWDFGMGASPNMSNDEEPTVTLGAPGAYDTATLRVEGPGGEDTFPFTLTVNEIAVGPILVDEAGGNYPSLAIVEGNPAIAYQRVGAESNPTCFFVRALDESGATWDTPVQAFPASGSFPGSHNRLTVVNGNPAITTSVGFYIEAGTVRYARANDSLGESWALPTDVWNLGMINSPPSGFCVADGMPAVALPEDKTSDGDLLYYRALDANGDDWPTDPVIASLGILTSTPLSCDMAIVGGGTLEPRPAILLSMYMGETLFILSSDPQGINWEAPSMPIETMSDVSALCVVAGNPAAAWRNGGELPRNLYYRRAIDEKGGDWGETVTLDSNIECSGRLGFAVINERPAVAYANGPWGSRYLYYTVADDAAGTSWCTPIQVRPGLNVTENVALLEVNGRPAIAYCEYGSPNSKLRYIRAADQYGYTWPE